MERLLFDNDYTYGAQFEALFTNNLYLDISRHSIDMVM